MLAGVPHSDYVDAGQQYSRALGDVNELCRVASTVLALKDKDELHLRPHERVHDEDNSWLKEPASGKPTFPDWKLVPVTLPKLPVPSRLQQINDAAKVPKKREIPQYRHSYIP